MLYGYISHRLCFTLFRMKVAINTARHTRHLYMLIKEFSEKYIFDLGIAEIKNDNRILHLF